MPKKLGLKQWTLVFEDSNITIENESKNRLKGKSQGTRSICLEQKIAGFRFNRSQMAGWLGGSSCHVKIWPFPRVSSLNLKQLVGGWGNTLLKTYEFVNWDDSSQYTEKNNWCSKPPTSFILWFLSDRFVHPNATGRLSGIPLLVVVVVETNHQPSCISFIHYPHNYYGWLNSYKVMPQVVSVQLIYKYYFTRVD